jgi:hypothetical protein
MAEIADLTAPPASSQEPGTILPPGWISPRPWAIRATPPTTFRHREERSDDPIASRIPVIASEQGERSNPVALGGPALLPCCHPERAQRVKDPVQLGGRHPRLAPSHGPRSVPFALTLQVGGGALSRRERVGVRACSSRSAVTLSAAKGLVELGDPAPRLAASHGPRSVPVYGRPCVGLALPAAFPRGRQRDPPRATEQAGSPWGPSSFARRCAPRAADTPRRSGRSVTRALRIYGLATGAAGFSSPPTLAPPARTPPENSPQGGGACQNEGSSLMWTIFRPCLVIVGACRSSSR